MTELSVSKDTGDIIELLHSLDTLGQHLYKRIYFLEEVKHEITVEDKKVIDEEITSINELFIRSITKAHNYLVDMENEFGGGWMDIGTSSTLKLISENEVTIQTVHDFITGYGSIIHKLVLLDSHRTGQEAIKASQQIYSNFTGGKKERAA